MELVYVETQSIILLLSDTLDIELVQRVRNRKPIPPHFIRVSNLVSTPNGRPRIIDRNLEIDGLGCIRLMWWIINEHPHASHQTKLNRFNALFADNPTDALKATLRIFAGNDDLAPGEDGYFCAQQWRNHPAEMETIALLGSLL